MNRPGLLVVFLFLVVSITSCAQTKHGIRKIHAFSREQMPGNIPMPGLGIPGGPDTVYTIYAETSDKNIQWDSAWVNNKTYTVKTVWLNENRAEPGIGKSNGEKIVLKGDNKWFLSVLYLVPAGHSMPPPSPAGQGGMLLKGRHQGKPLLHTVSQWVELLAIPSV